MKRLFLVLFISLFTAVSVNATDNVLQSVQVEPSGDSYNIVLVSDSPVTLKKTVQAPNRILLNLKGIRASKTLSTIYKNVTNVDNIIVESYGIDGLNILFQADNASEATVSFDTLISSVKVNKQANPQKEILLNAPMNTYKPIYQQEEEKNNAQSLLSNINYKGVLCYIKSMFSGTKTTTLLTFGFFGILFLLGAKLIRGRDNELRVGLTQNFKDNRDILNTREVPGMTKGFHSSLNKPYTTMNNNYGLKAYQNSTQSPYMNMAERKSNFTNLNSISSNRPAKQNNLMAKSVMANKTFPQQNIKSSNTMSTPRAGMKPQRVDSIKFLKSMSEIYEKSGRADLANGIRTKLSKISG